MKRNANSISEQLTGKEFVFDGQNTPTMTSGDYVWKDEKAPFVIKSTTGVNNPSWEEYIPGFEGIVFSGTTMNQVWVDFHFDHDIALNTKVYPHIHWMPLTTNTGIVRWGFQYIMAKGHGQSKFPITSSTVYLDHEVTVNDQYRHIVTETPDNLALLSNEIEPDTVIKFRIFRDGGVDTHNGKVHAWQADLHHQIARTGTKNRAPNFFE